MRGSTRWTLPRRVRTRGAQARWIRGLVVTVAVSLLCTGCLITNAATDSLSAGGVIAPGTVPADYQTWVIQAGSQCGQIVAPLIAAQLDVESSWNPNAVSPSGAQGLAQFMPGTWPSWGRDDDGNGRISPFDPGDAIMAKPGSCVTWWTKRLAWSRPAGSSGIRAISRWPPTTKSQ